MQLKVKNNKENGSCNNNKNDFGVVYNLIQQQQQNKTFVIYLFRSLFSIFKQSLQRQQKTIIRAFIISYVCYPFTTTTKLNIFHPFD